MRKRSQTKDEGTVKTVIELRKPPGEVEEVLRGEEIKEE